MLDPTAPTLDNNIDVALPKPGEETIPRFQFNSEETRATFDDPSEHVHSWKNPNLLKYLNEKLNTNPGFLSNLLEYTDRYFRCEMGRCHELARLMKQVNKIIEVSHTPCKIVRGNPVKDSSVNPPYMITTRKLDVTAVQKVTREAFRKQAALQIPFGKVAIEVENEWEGERGGTVPADHNRAVVACRQKWNIIKEMAAQCEDIKKIHQSSTAVDANRHLVVGNKEILYAYDMTQADDYNWDSSDETRQRILQDVTNNAVGMFQTAWGGKYHVINGGLYWITVKKGNDRLQEEANLRSYPAFINIVENHNMIQN